MNAKENPDGFPSHILSFRSLSALHIARRIEHLNWAVQWTVGEPVHRRATIICEANATDSPTGHQKETPPKWVVFLFTYYLFTLHYSLKPPPLVSVTREAFRANRCKGVSFLLYWQCKHFCIGRRLDEPRCMDFVFCRTDIHLYPGTHRCKTVSKTELVYLRRF